MERILMAVVTVLLTTLCFAQTDRINADEADTNAIAVVLGKDISVAEKDNIHGLVFDALLQQFATENKIEPTEQELDDFILKSEEKQKQFQINMEADRRELIEELKGSTLSDKERQQKSSELETIERILKNVREVKEQIKGVEEQQVRLAKRHNAQQFVKSWKINRALYEKHGGRIIIQQGGLEPLDAYRDFLKEQEKKGAFRIIDKQYEPEFWRYFTDDTMHKFYNKDAGAEFMNIPWWMMEEREE